MGPARNRYTRETKMPASKAKSASPQVNQPLPPEELHNVLPNGQDNVDPSELPSITPGDLGDFERFTASANEATARTAVAVLCSVGRLNNIDFFRVPTD